MRVGMVCEGQTDYITMASFLSIELAKQNIPVEFKLIQPALDNTLPSGWPQVLYWLEQNPLANRNALYRRGQSLFLNEDEDQKYDALIFQIDTDIIGEAGFEAFISKRNITCVRPASSIERGIFIQDVLVKISGHSTMTDALATKEVPIPLVESCETWIVAADSNSVDAEALTPEELKNSFGAVVAKISKQPIRETYENINKNMKTRTRICNSLSKTASPATKAPHFDQAVGNLRAVLGP